MRYKSIELINYAGIYNGMGLTQIKIDFTQCISNKIIIRGSNGSGKSTLMSAINPNPDSNDKFIPNAEARKTIIISDNNIDYVIRYIHPVTNSGRGTTKGYISKSINGQLVEMNPNGNISSCKDILYDEFGFDSGYISLAQLSSEDKGLVDKKPVERKKLVNSITNNLDTFNNIYKAVSKKASLLKNLINSLVNKIDMIGDESKVVAQLSNIEQRIESLERDKEKSLEAIAAVKIKISELQSMLIDNKYDEILTELSGVNRLVKTSEKQISEFMRNNNIENIDKLREFLIHIEHQIILLEAEIGSLNKKIPEILMQRENEFKSLQDKQERLNSLQSEYNYTDIKNAIENAEKVVSEYNEIFNKAGITNAELLTKDEFDTGMEALKYLKELAMALTSKWPLALLEQDINNRPVVLKEISQLQNYKNKYEQTRTLRDRLQAQVNEAAIDRRIASVLNQRPSECKIDSCSFISNAIIADNRTSEEAYNKLSTDLHNALIEEVQLNNRINDIMDMKLIREDIAAIERELKSKWRFIKRLPIRKDFIETFMFRVIALDQFHDIDDLYKFIDCGNMIEKYKVAKEQLRIYQSEFNLYKSKNNIIETIISDIQSLNDKTNALALDIEELNKQLFEKQNKLEELKEYKKRIEQILSKYNDVYKPNKERQVELNKLKESLDIGGNQIQVLNQQLSQLNTNIGATNSDIKNLSDIRDRLKHSLIMLSDYKIELDKYNTEYALIEKVKYYASPNTGIQSIFISIYMNKLLAQSNQLLSLLFGGEFTLLPFIVNESEFRIPCIGENLQHDDISSMSMAQKSMISLIISFALLHQSSTKYNIINLDEVDGALDSMNRSGFINLLDNLMAILNCEQAFIVSHNSELDSTGCDMIVLKNSSNELINGHIIWKY